MKELKQALRQQGHYLSSQGKISDTYLPNSENKNIIDSFEELLFSLMSDSEFRKKLRDWSFQEKVTFPSLINSYIELVNKFSTVEITRTQNRYSSTFEWYISSLMKRSFGAETSGFSVTLKDADPEDDFDVVAILNNDIFYAECKTGKDSFESAVEKFVRRDEQICANYSLFIYDRDWLFNRNNPLSDFPNFTKSKAETYGILNMSGVKGAGYDFKIIYCVQNRFFFELSAFGNLMENIRHTLRYYSYYRDGVHEKYYKTTSIPFKADNKKGH